MIKTEEDKINQNWKHFIPDPQTQERKKSDKASYLIIIKQNTVIFQTPLFKRENPILHITFDLQNLEIRLSKTPNSSGKLVVNWKHPPKNEYP
jgi:hypothetical protein